MIKYSLPLTFFLAASCTLTAKTKIVVDVTKIKFIGVDGKPEKGLIVERTYSNCSTESKEPYRGPEKQLSDDQGEVNFPKHTVEVIGWKDSMYWGGFHGCSDTYMGIEAKRKDAKVWDFYPSGDDRKKAYDIVVDFNRKTVSHGRFWK